MANDIRATTRTPDISTPERGPGRRRVVAAVTACATVFAGVSLGVAGPVRAVEAPPQSEQYFFQTSGPDAGLNIGDYYTSTGGAVVETPPAPNDHQLRIQVPCTPGSLPPVIVELFDPELGGISTAAPDEIRPDVLGADTSTFVLSDPNSNVLTNTSYPPTSPTDDTWVTFATFDPDVLGCGDYLVNVTTTGDDDNSWNVRANYDIDGSGAYEPANDRDDADGVPGTGDELVIAYDRVSMQHVTNTTGHFWWFVDESLVGTTVQLHNFDLDNGGTITYFSPSGSTISGTRSGNTAWNGGTSGTPPARGGDPVAITAADVGWWRAEIALGAGNQYIFEGVDGIPVVPLGPGAPPPYGEPELTITKDNGVASVAVGDTVTWNLTVANVSWGNVAPGPGPAAGITVVDTLPAGYSFVGCTIPNGTCSETAPGSGLVTFEFADQLPAGDPAPQFVATLTATVAVGAAAGAATNSARVEYFDVYGNGPKAATGTDTDTVLPAVDLSILKDDGGTTTSPGAVLVYTLTYDQTGTSDLGGVTITETVPADTTFDADASSPGWSCPDGAPPATSCLFDVGVLAAADGPTTVAFAVRTDDPYPAGMPDVSNTATIADDATNGPDVDPSDNSSTDTTPVVFAPDLVVTKTDTVTTGTEPAGAGDRIRYVVSVRNDGTAAATNVTVTDSPQGTVAIDTGSGVVSQGAISSITATTVTADLGTLAVGETATLTFDVVVDSPLVVGRDTVTNQATVTDDQGSAVVSDDPSQPGGSDANVTDLDVASTLAVTKTSSATGPVAPGDTISYTIAVTNTGTTDLTAITANDAVPAGTGYVANSALVDGPIARDDFEPDARYDRGEGWAGDWTELGDDGDPAEGPGGTCGAGGVCLVDDLFSTRIRIEGDDTGFSRAVDLTTAQAASLDFVYRRDALTDRTVTVYALQVPPTTCSPVGGFPAGSQLLQLGDGTDPTYQAATDLALPVGGVVYITACLQPTGSSPGGGVDLDDFVVEGVRSSSAPAALTSTPVLAPGDTATYTFDVVVDDPLAASVTSIDNQVVADSAETAPQVAAVGDAVVAPTVTATKTDSIALTDVVVPGDTVTYTVEVRNTSAVSATSVTFTDTPDVNTALVIGSVTSTQGTVTGGNTAGDTTVVVDLSTLAPGAVATIDFDVVVDNPFPGGVSTVSNQGTISGDRFAAVDTSDPEAPGQPTITNVAAAPELVLSKSDSLATPVAPGDTVTYTLVVSNVGTTTATNVAVTDSAPVGAGFVVGSVTSTAGTISSGNAFGDTSMTVDIGSLSAGTSETITFDVVVDDPFPSSRTELSNVAHASSTETGVVVSDDPDVDPGTDDPTVTPVTAAPVLTISKSDTATLTTPGATDIYVISVGNTGNQVATGIELTETVPDGTTHDPGSSDPGWDCGGATAAGTTCTFTIATLVPGGTVDVDFAVSIDTPASSGRTEIVNSVEITAEDHLSSFPAPATDTNTLVAAPLLTVTKNAPAGAVNPGATITYTVVVSNTGDQDDTNVVFTDTPGTDTELVPGTVAIAAPGTGTVTTGNGATDTDVEVALGSLGGGESVTITFDVIVDDPYPTPSGVVLNQGFVTSDTFTSAIPSDDPDLPGAVDPTPTVVAATPVLTATKTDSPGTPAAPGDRISYTIVITNSGTTAATDVVVTDTPDANTTLDAASVTLSPSSAGTVSTPGGSQVAVDLGTVAVGEIVTIGFDVIVDAPFPAGVDQVSNQATVTSAELPDVLSDDPDVNPGGWDATVTPVTAAPDLTISKADAGATITPGDRIVYTITYRNVGTQDATGVVITETVPAGTTFSTTDSTTGWSCTPDATAGSTCTYAVGSLAAGAAAAAVDFAVDVASPAAAGFDAVDNVVTIADDGANGPDPTPLDNRATFRTPVTASPALVATKTDSVPLTTAVAPGTIVTYTIDITNIGDEVASGVTFVDLVPAHTAIVTGSLTVPAGSTIDNGSTAGDLTVDVRLPDLGTSTPHTISFQVVVDTPLAAGVTAITNQGTADATDAPAVNTDDPETAVTGDATVTNIAAAPDLTVSKTDGDISAAPGDTIVYTLTYDNAGDQDATGVTLTETVPTGTTFAATSSTAGWVCTPDASAASTCVLSLGTVAAAADPVDVDFAVTLPDPVAAGFDLVSNTAAIADDGTNGFDPSPADNTDTDTTPVVAAPIISATKSDAVSTNTAGETVVSYVVEISNSGNEDAGNVTFVDTPDPNTSLVAGSVTVTPSTGSTIDTTGGSVTVAVATLGGGSIVSPTTVTIEFDVIVDDPLAAGVHSVSNQGTVTADGPIVTVTDDPDTPVSDDPTVTPIAFAPDLTITKDDGGVSVAWGSQASYTLSYRNVGHQDATGVVITETVPAGTTFDASSSTSGWSCTPDADAGSTCTFAIVGTVAAGAPSVDVGFVVTIDNPVTGGQTAVSNTATIADDGANGTDEAPADNTASDTTPILDPPNLTITKTGPAGPVEPGDLVTFTLAYANTGATAANAVVVEDVVPPGTTFVAAGSDAGWSCGDADPAGTSCTVTVGTLGPGATGSVDIVMRVDEPLAAGVTEVDNTATIDDDDVYGVDLFDDSSNDTVSITSGSVGDLVWYDVDGDGLRDVTEPGVGGVTLTLRDSGGNVVATTVTAPGGTYDFGGLGSGSYSVEITAGLPADAVVAPATPIAVVLAVGGDVNEADFAITGTSTIGDTVYLDENANGSQQAGETTGVGGVTVELLSGGSVVATTTTAADGTYSFRNLLAGDYRVQAAAAGLPSGASVTTPLPIDVSGLAAGVTVDTVDIGIAGTGTIGDTVFVDLDGNGTQDTSPGSGEVSVEGVVVILSDGSGTEIARRTTDATGSYSFENLVAGDYLITVDVSALPNATDYTVTTPDPYPVALPDGLTGSDNTIDDADIGINALGSIAGTVWVDADENGVQDTATGTIEPGQPGVTVRLLDGAGNAVVDGTGTAVTSVTGADGSYSFAGLVAGDYRVLVDTTTLPANHDLVTATPNDAPVTLAPGDDVTGIDFGINAPAVIAGGLYIDRNGDGIHDPAETAGLGGVEISLFEGGAVVLTTSTAADGSYTFAGLLAGTYQTAVTGALPSGYTLTTPANSGDVTVGVGETVTDVDFGANAPGTIGDLVWYDVDGDGVQGSSEPGLAGVVVELVDGNGDVVDTATTAADGSYDFTDVDADTYTVRIAAASVPANTTYTNTVGGSVTVVLALNGDVDTADFGLRGSGSIGDTVFTDADGDGTQAGPLEVGRAGIEIVLEYRSGGIDVEIARTISTGASGNYSFTDLYAGDYRVRVEPSSLPAGYSITTTDPQPVVVGDGTAGSAAIVLDADIGINAPGSIGGTLFVDADSSGAIEADETATLTGVAVALIDGDGVTVDTTTTSADGSYLFTDVVAGDYTVVLATASLAAIHPGYSATMPTILPVSLGVDDDRVGFDFGANNPSDLSGVVWVDADNDDVRDVTENAAVPDVTAVEIVLLDEFGNEIGRTNLDTAGGYSFTDVVAGRYTIEVDESTLPTTPATYNLTAPNGEIVDLGVDDDRTGIDFGVNAVGVIGDRVWLDRDRDGIEDADETYGLAGVDVVLRRTDGTVVERQTTNASGGYRFVGVLADTYDVIVDAATFPGGVTATTPTTRRVTIAAGESDLDVDFGGVGAGSIGDLVWFDTDGDGTAQAGEPGRPGVRMIVRDRAGAVVADAVSDAAGAYSVVGLPAGDFTVEVDPTTVPVGFAITTLGDPANPYVLTLAAGEAVETADVGVRAGGTIGDLVFLDADGDGLVDAGDAGRGGIVVVLLDSTGTEVTRTTSAADGSYRFDDVDAGDYGVTVDPASLPVGFSVTTTDPQPVTVTANSLDDTIDIGVVGRGALTGVVFADRDGDGVLDASETGQPGAVVVVTDGSGTEVARVPVAVDGSYTAAGLPVGAYTVAVDPGSLPAGSLITTAPPATVVVITDTTTPVDPIGVTRLGVVAGSVWHDADADASFDTTEVGLTGVVVTLVDQATGATVASGTTGPTGAFVFDGVRPGTYEVRVGVDTLPVAVRTQTADPDGALDSRTEAVVIDGSGPSGLDFGYASTPPTAIDDQRTTNEDTPVIVAVLDNDLDPIGAGLTIENATAPDHGVAEVLSDGTIRYTPNPGFHGTDVFSYTICDAADQCVTANVLITVNGAPDVPELTITVGPGQPVPPLGWTDPERHDVMFEFVSGTLPDGVSLDTDGSFEGTPHRTGTFTFVVRACDTLGACTDSSVTITVRTVNRLPTTGGSADALVHLAFAALLAGAFLVLSARRRDRERRLAG